MYVTHHLSENFFKIYVQGEGEHKRSKQFYPRVRKGDHVRGIAQHVYRERTLYQVQETNALNATSGKRPINLWRLCLTERCL